ncbi:MAG: 2-deoxy-5-keto-D-gluconate 6-phosphate aldolase domain-containing protein [Candidatus Dormibacteraceae bacterium]
MPTQPKNLFMLAFDQRGSFTTGLFDIRGKPTREETARIADAKRVIFEGLNLAVLEGVPMANAGLLVDEQFGAEVARTAKASGYTLAMPVEKSGQNEFNFEYGADFRKHIETFDPAYAKVLVRYNPDGGSVMNTRQLTRLAELSSWLRGHDRRLLFELLVPPEPAQLEKVGGDSDVYDREIRPELTIRAIVEAQAAGVEPEIWKIEGLDRREDYERVAERARSGGREGVACIILGRGARETTLENWLRQEAGVSGFIGFAIGRTIWQRALRDWLAGKLDREGASRMIANNYLRMVEVYLGAGVA